MKHVTRKRCNTNDTNMNDANVRECKEGIGEREIVRGALRKKNWRNTQTYPALSSPNPQQTARRRKAFKVIAYSSREMEYTKKQRMCRMDV